MAAQHGQSDDVLRVASGTPVGDLASAIAHGVYDGREVVLRYVGAAAGQQAIKAVAVARGMVAPRGIDLSIVPGFCDIDMGDKVVTGITLKVIVG